MIEKDIRASLETSLLSNFNTVELTIPPTNTTTIEFNSVIGYQIQDALDQIIKQSENKIVVQVTYPSMDLPFARFAYDLLGNRKVKYKLSEVVQSGVLRINGATTGEFSFTMTEPYLFSIEIYTEIPAGTTSWLTFELFDNLDNRIIRKTIFTTHCKDKDYIEIPIGKVFRLNPITGTTETLKVKISEDTFGSNPIGIDIGTDGGPNIAHKINTSQVRNVFGKINLGIMRLSVFAGDKPKGQDPNPNDFMIKDDIVSQFCELLRKYIHSNWIIYGLNDILVTQISADEYDNSVPFASAFIDVSISVPDIGTLIDPTLPLKDLNIEDIRGV